VKTTLIPADVTNANAHRYPPESLKQAFVKLPKELTGTIGYVDHPTPSQAAFKATDFALNEHGDLTVQIEILDTPCGKELQKLVEKGQVAFRTCGTGNLDGDKVVDFEITALAALLKIDDAFGDL